MLVPNEVWDPFRTLALESDEDPVHQHVLLEAYRRGVLGQLTSSVHRYLVHFDRSRIELNKNYLNDLREAWVPQNLSMKFPKTSRAFLGRLTELRVAEWLEEMGWTISKLEAWGGQPDIECTSPTRTKCAIEVNSIVGEDLEYISDQNRPEMCGVPRPPSPYQASNLVLFRGLEAADKLRECEKVRIACLVVSEEMWQRFKPSLRAGWNVWDMPRFIEIHPKLQKMIQLKKRINSLTREELKHTISRLNAIWIVKKSHGFLLSSHRVVALKDPSPSPYAKTESRTPVTSS